MVGLLYINSSKYNLRLYYICLYHTYIIQCIYSIIRHSGGSRVRGAYCRCVSVLICRAQEPGSCCSAASRGHKHCAAGSSLAGGLGCCWRPFGRRQAAQGDGAAAAALPGPLPADGCHPSQAGSLALIRMLPAHSLCKHDNQPFARCQEVKPP